MLDTIGKYIVAVADFVCGYPLFFMLIGGGLYLFITSGFVSVRRLPASVRELRRKNTGTSANKDVQISSVQALLSAVAGTIGLGNIAGVAIALVMGGPGAIFWMWVSAIVGMSTKFHEGALAVMYRGKDNDGKPRGGIMYIIEHGLGQRWKPLARTFSIAGLFGTLCIINANQLAEGISSMLPHQEALSPLTIRFIIGLGIALLTALVVLRGVTRIARVATVLVPFMVGVYFLMVLYIIFTNLGDVPGVFKSIFTEAFNLRAGFGAFAGIAIIGARRAALVNDAGVGTATIMHGSSKNNEPVREGLIAMLGPSIDSGFVCTLTAVALLLCGDFSNTEGLKGLEMAMQTFDAAIPYGAVLLMFVAVCFGLSSMFSYSYYGTSCATYLFGAKRARWYTYAYILSLILFAVVPLEAAVGMCDLFYACMAIPTMITLIALSSRVRPLIKQYFNHEKQQ